jgi:hypothetical protein
MAIRWSLLLVPAAIFLACVDNPSESASDDDDDASAENSEDTSQDESDDDDDDENTEAQDDDDDNDDDSETEDDDDDGSESDMETTPADDDDEDSETQDDDDDDGMSSEESSETTTTEEDIPCADQIEITEDFLLQKLSELSGKEPAMVDGKMVTINERATDENRANARQYLREFYEGLGYVVSEQAYGNKGVNLIAERKTESDKVFLVGAHYDSVSGGPGADDDGGGVVQGMAMALALQNCKLEHTLRIVAFDQEELGLLGSRAYAKEIRDNGESKAIIGMLQQEMPGWDGNGDAIYQVIDCDRSESKFLTDGIRDALELKDIQLTLETECTERSDHASFWEIGLPAVMTLERYFGPGSDYTPCYHKPCDTVDDLDFNYMQKITWANTIAAAKFLGAP